MKIGIIKERKHDERRVALRPEQVDLLGKLGHEVFVEMGAGELAGYTDKDYASATIVDQETLYKNSSLLLKVKCPEPQEYKFLNEKHTLFCYLHFDENIPPENITKIVSTGVTGIAYEWVENCGEFPLLQPMSELTGSLFALKSMSLLLEKKGKMGTAYAQGATPPVAAVVGVGNIGKKAIAAFILNGFDLVIVDKHPETLPERLCKIMPEFSWDALSKRITVIVFDETNHQNAIGQLKLLLPHIDILICAAVRRQSLPKSTCNYLIDRKSLALMRPHSVICDATACDKDFIETAVSSSSLTDYYIEEEVIHYNCDHIPSLASQTSTYLLTEATFPFVIKLSEGFDSAVRADSALKSGVMCHKGKLTHQYSAEKKLMDWSKLDEIL
jgi:alanine dehydrogenase